MARVEFQNIVKQYGRVTVLDDLDLTATAFLAAGDQLISVRIDPGAVNAIGTDKPVKMSFPGNKLNVFDARSGRRM